MRNFPSANVTPGQKVFPHELLAMTGKSIKDANAMPTLVRYIPLRSRILML